MNEQKKLKKEFKLWPILIVFVIVSLLISAVLIAITPQKDVVSQTEFVSSNYDNSQTNFKKIKFTGENIQVAEKFKIYRPVAVEGLADDLANKIINEYQLEAVDKLPNYWIKGNYALNKNTYENRYSFGLDEEKPQNDLKIIVNEAIKSCLNFYSKYSISLPLIPQQDNLLYLDGKLEQAQVKPEQAIYLQIPLTYELDGYPVFYQNEDNYPFFCKIDNNYQIEKAVFKDFFYNFESVKEVSSINIDQAVKNIKNGQASIIKADSKILDIIDLNWINEADLYSVSIDYRFDEKLKIVYPFYKFKSKLTNTAGINIEALIITPAIETAKEK